MARVRPLYRYLAPLYRALCKGLAAPTDESHGTGPEFVGPEPTSSPPGPAHDSPFVVVGRWPTMCQCWLQIMQCIVDK